MISTMLCNWTWNLSDLEIRPMKLDSLRNLKIHVAISYVCMGRCMVIMHCSLCNFLCFAFKAPKTQFRYMIMSLSLALNFLHFTDWCSYYYTLHMDCRQDDLCSLCPLFNNVVLYKWHSTGVVWLQSEDMTNNSMCQLIK